MILFHMAGMGGNWSANSQTSYGGGDGTVGEDGWAVLYFKSKTTVS